MEAINQILVEPISTNSTNALSKTDSDLSFDMTLEEMITKLSGTVGLADSLLANLTDVLEDGSQDTEELSKQDESTSSRSVNGEEKKLSDGLVSISESLQNPLSAALGQSLGGQFAEENAGIRLDSIDDIEGSLPEKATGQAEALNPGVTELIKPFVQNQALQGSESVTTQADIGQEISGNGNAAASQYAAVNESSASVIDTSGASISNLLDRALNVDQSSIGAGNFSLNLLNESGQGSENKVEQKIKDVPVNERNIDVKAEDGIAKDPVTSRLLILDKAAGRLQSLLSPEHVEYQSEQGRGITEGSTIQQIANQPPALNVMNAGVDGKTYVQVQAKDTVGQIIQQIAVTVSQGKSNARIQLKPEFLGELRVKIELSGNQLTAKLETVNAITKELLEAGVTQVKQALQAHGIKVDEVIVQLKGEQSHDPGHERFTGENQDGRHGNGSYKRFQEEQDLPAGWAGDRGGRYLLGGLNEWVA
jgi:flagellar hook-length control protein FliK